MAQPLSANMRLKKGIIPDDESDSGESGSDSFLEGLEVKTQVRKETVKRAKKKAQQNPEENDTLKRFENISKHTRKGPAIRKQKSRALKGSFDEQIKISTPTDKSGSSFLSPEEIENKLRAKMGGVEKEKEPSKDDLYAGFRLRQKPFKNESSEFQQDAFFDYIEVLLGDAQVIEEYLNFNVNDLQNCVEAVGWLNRQFVLNNFLQQTLTFHQDYIILFECAKKRDQMKFRAMQMKSSSSVRSQQTVQTMDTQKTLRNKSRQMVEIETQAMELIKHLLLMNTFYKDIHRFDVCLKILWEIDCFHTNLFNKRRPQYAQNFYEMALVYLLADQVKESEFAFKKAMAEAERLLGRNKKAVGTWCSNIGHLHHQKGDLIRARDYFLEALEIDKNCGSSEDNEDVALDFENLAFVHADRKELDEAIKCIKEALRINKLCLGDIHKDVARNLASLSQLLIKANDLDQAEKYLRIAIGINEKCFGNASSELANSLFDLASVLKIQGNVEESLKFMEDSISVFSAAKKKSDDPKKAKALVELAVLLRGDGNLEKALDLLKEALAIRNSSDVEADMVSIAAIYFHIGEVLRDLGRLNDALQNLTKALEMRKQVVGTKNKVLPHTMNVIANLLADMNRLPESLAYHKAVLKLDKQILGDVHPDVATDLTNVATLLADLGNYDEAMENANESLEIRRKVFGEEHPLFASALNNKACIYRGQGSFTEAEKLYKEAIALGMKTLGEDHADVALRKNNLAELLQKLGRVEEAEALYREVLDSWTKSQGENHPRVGLVVSSLALLLTDQGRYFEALPFQFQALDIDKQTYGERDLTVARDLNNLGKLLRTLGQLKEAEPCIVEALSIRREKLGNKHAHLALSIENLALLRRAQKRDVEAVKLGKDGYYMFVDTLGENHQWTIYSRNLWFNQASEGKVQLQERDFVARDMLENDRLMTEFSFDEVKTLSSSRQDSAPDF